MTADDVAATDAGARWRINTGRTADELVAPAVNGGLSWCQPDDHSAGYWQAAGERPCFRLDRDSLSQALPAGWYMLDCRFEMLAGKLALPSLCPQYVGHPPLTRADVMLPEPDVTGRLESLLLFFDDVAVVEFCLGVVPASFRLHEVTLRRVPRLQALRIMLGGPNTTLHAHIMRFLAWGIVALRRGRRHATDKLYVDYRERLSPPQNNHYQTWCHKYDTLTLPMLAALREHAQELAKAGPLISVLLPVYNTPERWLRRCLDSVLNQLWERWELCIADDASTSPHVCKVLDDYAARDARIRVTRRAENGHISAASNTALAMAQGDVIALLDHDDELRPHALLRIAEAVVAFPKLEILYSDEDKLDANGERYDPNFKPDWNPELLHGQNYFCHLTAIRTGLVRAAGGFREGFEGSQDYDLVLRCVEKLESAQIHHVPEILYHWRATEGSTATVREAKDYATPAGVRALTEHFQRTGAGATVRTDELPPTLYRVRWPLPKPAPKISLIIPTRDRVDLLRMCVESIQGKSTYPDYELVIVDNQSEDPATLAYLREINARENVRVLRYDAPFNYSRINNWAANKCDGPLIALVNNDIEVITPDWLEELAGFAMRPDTGVVGAMLYYPNDTIQHAGVVLGILGVAEHISVRKPRGYGGHAGRGLVAQNLSAVTGACMMVRRTVYQEVGGLDEALRIAFNDVDFCLRVRTCGYRNVWTPFAELYHHESASRGQENTDAKIARFNTEIALMRERWGDSLLNDPAYNPNLSLLTNFELAFPPRTTGFGKSARLDSTPRR